jgi:putative membrane protein
MLTKIFHSTSSSVNIASCTKVIKGNKSTHKNMKYRMPLLFAGLLLLFVSSCREDEIIDDSLSEQDRAFLREASYRNIAEIELGELAAMQGQNESVQVYGQQMVTDHSSAQGDLRGLANLKEEPLDDNLKTEDATLVELLAGMTGFQFDSAYLHHQVIRHEDTRDLFQGYINDANDPDLLDYAVTNLPDIIIHLERAEELRQELGAAGI